MISDNLTKNITPKEFSTGLEFERLKNRVLDLSSLIEVSIIINSTLDLAELLKLVMEKAQSVMQAQASSVMLINEETDLLECEVALGEASAEVKEKILLRRGQGIAGTVWDTGQALIVANAQEDQRFFPDVDLYSGFVTRSIIAAPLKVRGRIIGVAEVLNRKDGNPFTPENLDLFETFCRQVAMTIENARLHQYELEQERLQQQLESARAIQESFMPQRIPVCPRGRYQLAAKTRPAKMVGGDFFDFIEFDVDHLGIAIGDVSGKGIPAALYMARLVSDFRFLAQKGGAPGETLTELNSLLVERSRRGIFVTMQYLILDIPTGEVQIADAGHLPPLIRSGDGTRTLELEGGMPLGIVRGARFETTRLALYENDKLCLYTDGAIEAKNKQGEQFSLAHLLNVFQEDGASPDQVLKNIISALTGFSKKVPQHDDITLLILKRNHS